MFSQLTVQQNLELGAYTRTDSSEAVAADYEMVFERLPRLKRARKQIGRHAFRRGTADACHWARTDVQPAHAADG